MNEKLEELYLYAWVGPDDGFPVESRTEEIGLKQARTPAGFIPLVSTRPEKVDRVEVNGALHAMARATGRERMLVRFRFDRVLKTIVPAGSGSPEPPEIPLGGLLDLP